MQFATVQFNTIASFQRQIQDNVFGKEILETYHLALLIFRRSRDCLCLDNL